MSADELEELEELMREDYLNSLGDRPHSMPAERLRRLIELETKLRKEEDQEPKNCMKKHKSRSESASLDCGKLRTKSYAANL